jgi:Mg2+ and Co2+ transporter CorA
MYTSFDQWFNTKNILNDGKLEEHKELFEECWNNVESLHKEQIEDLKDEVEDLESELEESEGNEGWMEDDLENLRNWRSQVIELFNSLTVSKEDREKIDKLIEEGEDL